MKETELFLPVKSWLEYGGNSVFSEVQPKRGTLRRADLLGLHGPVDTVVELKTSLSLVLLDQCVGWREHANLVYAAVPAPVRYVHGQLISNFVPELALEIMKMYGIGLLYVSEEKVHNVIRAKLNRKIKPILREALTEYHLTHSPDAGSNKGGHVTAYRTTILRVREFLERMHDRYDHERANLRCQDGWVSLPDLLERCSTHYSSPKNSLAAALSNYESEWCECMLISGKRHYRLKPDLLSKRSKS
ncbi:hypothetical protein [Paenibacillus sp. AGC30]